MLIGDPQAPRPARRWRVVLLAAALVAVPAWAGAGLDRDGRWNRFVAQLYTLHQKILATHQVRELSRIGGYSRYPAFYEEVQYLDAASGRVLSTVRWERERLEGLWGGLIALFRDPVPQRGLRYIHSIAVNVYDRAGRLLRDYSATFLPDYRKVPTQTLIFLHDYPGRLHAWRGFDASGNRIYEGCRGRLAGAAVELDLDDDDIANARDGESGLMDSTVYRACFGRLPEVAGPYLTPH